ncbi:hypothetical protein JOE21_001342 [Desmospora profundinema]|uniref:Uncharacterized protein n=1 Tax=Desmospora profundinema TaxID=1571184 RepID=A0ABU1IMZ3_9BACL|nr:hypothetical protein [Desmospora profundinema]
MLTITLTNKFASFRMEQNKYTKLHMYTLI